VSPVLGTLELGHGWLGHGGLEGVRVEDADAAVGAYGVGEGEGVPVLVGVGGFVTGGVERAPVSAVVGGDVGAVGSYGDPGVGGGVVGYRAAVATWHRLRQLEFIAASSKRCGCSPVTGVLIIPSYRNDFGLPAVRAAGKFVRLRTFD